MRKSSLEMARPSILEYFSGKSKSVYKRKELHDIFFTKWENWHLTQSLSSKKFIKFLTDESILKELTFNFRNRKETRFIRSGTSLLSTLMAINNQGYISHFTALKLNNLDSSNEKKIIYWNVEQLKKANSGTITSQESITNSFKNKGRASNNICELEGYTIYGINGMNTGNLGVIEVDEIRFTNVERTLIDIIVRPQYSGGVKNILAAFRKAKGKVNIHQLARYYKQLEYVYPYHQALGFCLEKAGYPEKDIEVFSRMKVKFDFYLDYQMKNPKYSKKWRMYYPQELEEYFPEEIG